MVSRFFEPDSNLRFQQRTHKKPGMLERLWKKANPQMRARKAATQPCFETDMSAGDHLSWEHLCSSVSAEFRLSPRESEVMYLLSIGRNTQRISEILHISPSTTKSHAYRIYQKMQTHTQQEIIDCIEHYACNGTIANDR